MRREVGVKKTAHRCRWASGRRPLVPRAVANWKNGKAAGSWRLRDNQMPEEPALPTAACLDRPYSSSHKGGTLIAEDVMTLEEHGSRLRSPDGYRPRPCVGCGNERVHAHDHRERVLAGEVEGPPKVLIRRFRCAACRAVWRVLPAFLARHLWRRWPTVAAALQNDSSTARGGVATRTRRRWRARLRSLASLLVHSIVTSDVPKLVSRVRDLGLRATRHSVVEAFGGLGRIAPLAAWVHRLVPGVRVM